MRVNQLATRAYAFSRLPRLVRSAIAGRRASILFYHDPDPAAFDAHLVWLRQNADPVSMDELLAACSSGGGAGLPRHPVAITIDDGHRRNFELLPAIVRHRVPVLVYLAAGIVGTRRRFWFEVVRSAGGDTGLYKKMEDDERLAELNRRYDFEPEREYPEATALSWEQIGAMQATGLVAFGSHTVTHPILTRCSDTVAEREIADSRRTIETRLGVPVLHFAYPNGSSGQRERTMAAAAGYRTARGTAAGWCRIGGGTDLFGLPVAGIPEGRPAGDLDLLLGGLGQAFAALGSVRSRLR